MKRFLLAVLWLVVAGFAVTATWAQNKAAKGNASVEDTIRARFEQRFNAKPTTVKPTPFGLYEVAIGTEIAYVDKEVNYVFLGRVLDAQTKDDLTQRTRDELLKVDYKTFPLDQAVKIVRGNGSRQFVTFEDPNCGFCRKLFKDIAGMKNVTIYTFLYPILSPDSFEKAKAVWCAKDRAAAWADLMNDGKAPPAAAADCKHPLQQTLDLGQKLEVTGTPTIFFTDGRRLPGAVPLERIEAALARASEKK